MVFLLKIIFPVFTDQDHDFAPADNDCTGINGNLALGLAKVVVRGSVILEPFSFQSDQISHCMQFLDGIGQHMGHLHASQGMQCVVNVYWHERDE